MSGKKVVENKVKSAIFFCAHLNVFLEDALVPDEEKKLFLGFVQSLLELPDVRLDLVDLQQFTLLIKTFKVINNNL